MIDILAHNLAPVMFLALIGFLLRSCSGNLAMDSIK